MTRVVALACLSAPPLAAFGALVVAWWRSRRSADQTPDHLAPPAGWSPPPDFRIVPAPPARQLFDGEQS